MNEQIGGAAGFPLVSAAVWNICRFVPESILHSRLPYLSGVPRVAAALVVAFGVAACGPSGGGATPDIFAIRFVLSETPQTLTQLDFRVTYSGGSFVGGGDTVSCDLMLGDEADFNDNDGNLLTVEIDAEDEKLTEGAEIVVCEFQATTQPTPDNFTITITDADPADPGDVSVVVVETEPALVGGVEEIAE